MAAEGLRSLHLSETRDDTAHILHQTNSSPSYSQEHFATANNTMIYTWVFMLLELSLQSRFLEVGWLGQKVSGKVSVSFVG